MPAPKPTKTRTLALTMDEREFPLHIKVNPRSRRLILRFCARSQAVLLTLPRRVSLEEGMAFVESRKPWLRAQIFAQPQRVRFIEGAVIPVCGEHLTLRHVPGGSPVAWREENNLCVGGTPENMELRIRRWLLSHAKATIGTIAQEKAALLGRTPSRITLRDTTSLWGSCTAKGALSFSWRLILAPPEVMDYVICHEAAHLVHLHHGLRFWKVVENLCPHHLHARAWLRAQGEDLHRYG